MIVALYLASVVAALCNGAPVVEAYDEDSFWIGCSGYEATYDEFDGLQWWGWNPGIPRE